jgi:hypothetical protein
MRVDLWLLKDIHQRQAARFDGPDDRGKSRLDLVVLPSGEHGWRGLETLGKFGLRQPRHSPGPANYLTSRHHRIFA